MEAHSSIPVWKIPWTEKPGVLRSMGSPRVGCNQAHTHARIIEIMLFERKDLRS